MAVLKNWIQAREIAFSQRDNNRKVRPFSWGLEYLTEFASPAIAFNGNGVAPFQTAIEPRKFLHRYTEMAVEHSDEYFAAPPTSDYKLDGDALRFPSAIESPDDSNNTVHARFFPDKNRKCAVIVLPQWNADSEGHVSLCQLLARFGVSALRISLPYHHDRRPRHLERSEHLVCSNVGLTLQSNRQAVLDVRRAADWLEHEGYERIGIMGTSIGSCVAFLTMAHDKRINVGVYNHASSYFADVVWNGLSTKHVKEGLESEVTLTELRKFWSVLSPQTFISRLRNREQKSLIISGRYDLSFPFDLTMQAISEFRNHRIPVKHVVLPCGHYTLGTFPFAYIDAFLVTSFFRKHLR